MAEENNLEKKIQQLKKEAKANPLSDNERWAKRWNKEFEGLSTPNSSTKNEVVDNGLKEELTNDKEKTLKKK